MVDKAHSLPQKIKAPLDQGGAGGSDSDLRDRPARELTVDMAAAGASAYREWEANPRERGKLNAVANLVAKVFRSMEAQRRRER